MPIIHINVKEKIAKGNKDEFIVCNNSDYEILFDFDKEWEEYNHKTAIVTLSNREFVPILFDGNKCKLPPLQNATFCKIGVMASLENDDATIRISTTTPASINCLESAYDENGEILPPTDDIYQQILAKLNDINTNISRGGTTVTVDGVAQETWSADTKLDKFTQANGERRIYAVDRKGNQYMSYLTESATEILPGWIPTYRSKNDNIPELTAENVGILVTGTPTRPNHCVTKKYVDDGLSGKLDKTTSVVGGFNLYGTKYNDPTTQMWIIDAGNATQSHIPLYYESTNPYITNHANGGVLVTSTPLQPIHAANKKYVDDGLSGKVPITPDGFSATYAGLFGKTSAGEIEVVNKASYWDGIENLTGYNNNGSVAGYSHRATGENVLYTGTPDMPSQAANKKYVDTGLDGKLDKVTDAFKIYGTGDNGIQKVYPAGWGPYSGILQIMDYTPNGSYDDDGSIKSGGGGTYKVGIPSKPSHATPKKWVEDTVKLYKHTIRIRVAGDVTYSIHALNHTATAIETFSDVGTVEGVSKIVINDAGSYGVIVDIINFNFYKPNEDTLGILTIEGLVFGEFANGRQTFEITESDISEIGDYVV